jgi:hypothetical protein
MWGKGPGVGKVFGEERAKPRVVSPHIRMARNDLAEVHEKLKQAVTDAMPYIFCALIR